MPPPKSVLICHHDDPLNRYGLARWLASFTDLAAIIVIREPKRRFRQRIKREIARVGLLRFLDVVAFRIYYRLLRAAHDRAWSGALLNALEQRYPPVPVSTEILETSSPNSEETFRLLDRIQPDFMLARCKNILKERIFRLARRGTFVMHPGICPEYRNAHGCFWALARRDLQKVGMTLLKVDAGVDTGAVYGYYRYPFDEVNETHVVIQHRTVFENLDGLRSKLEEAIAGTAQTIDTTGRSSRAWGQPWLTRYLAWKLAARRRH